MLWERKRKQKPRIENYSKLTDLLMEHINNVGLWNQSFEMSNFVQKLATFCFVACIIFQIIRIFDVSKDSVKLFESFSVLTFCCMGLLKGIIFIVFKSRWLKIFSHINNLEKDESHLYDNPVEYESEDENEVKLASSYITKYTEQCRSNISVIFKMYRLTLVIFLCTPFLEYLISKVRGLEPEYPHILSQWAPLDDNNIYGYIATTFFFEIIACTYCVYIHEAFDSAAIGVIMFICGQFSFVRDYSGCICGLGNNLLLNEKRNARAHIRIIGCHTIHNFLISTLIELDVVLNKLLGAYFLVATLTICSVAVRLNSEELSVMQLISLIQYTIGLMTQLALFCYFGDAVLHESFIKAGCGLFSSAWWCVSPGVRKELHLLSFGLARHWEIRAGPFNSLDLPSLVMILRTAYSYYAVVRK